MNLLTGASLLALAKSIYYGPVEGQRHDSGMLASSGLLQDPKKFSNNQLLFYLSVCTATRHTLLEHTYRDLLREQC